MKQRTTSSLLWATFKLRCVKPYKAFRAWRRSLNPELVELDAYRTMTRVDAKLKEWPTGIPLLEAGLKAAKITGMDDKWYSYAVRLRDYTPPERGKDLGREIGTPRKKRDGVASVVACESAAGGGDRLERDCQAAIEVIRKTHRASISHFQRMLDWGYNHAALVVDTLESRGVIGPQIGMGSREILNVPSLRMAF